MLPSTTFASLVETSSEKNGCWSINEERSVKETIHEYYINSAVWVWPKSLFRSFHKLLQMNSNKLFGQSSVTNALWAKQDQKLGFLLLCEIGVFALHKAGKKLFQREVNVCRIMAVVAEGWGEGTVREFGMGMYTLLHLKWITNKDLLGSTGNSARCYAAAWMGGEFAEWIHVYAWVSPFTVHFKLS